MSTAWLIALIIGSAIIAGLSFYLGRLLMMIKQNQQAAEKTQAAEAAKRNKNLSESIYTIAWHRTSSQ